MSFDISIPEIEYRKTVDSTNAVLKSRITEGELHGAACLRADEQTAGRGRRGRSWLNTERALMMSAAIPLEGIEPDHIPLVSIAAAIAARNAVASCGIDAGIKWPNDIVVMRGDGIVKLCGILCELASTPENEFYAVIGIGINVNCKTLPEDLMQPASSILLETGNEIDIETLAAKLLECVIGEVELLSADAEKTLEKYKENCVTIGRNVHATTLFEDTLIDGEAVGIDRNGRLLVHRGERTVAIGAADVSVRFDNEKH